MKAKKINIDWHDSEPVLSLDFHPSGLLATGGGDKKSRCAPPLTEGPLQSLRNLISY